MSFVAVQYILFHTGCGENDCGSVLLLKEDSLNMNCDWWCNSVVATVHSDFAV